MARSHANDGRVFRAVITRTYADGRAASRTFGPYDNPAPAKGLITRAAGLAAASRGPRRDPDRAFTVSARIETAEVVWKAV